MISIRIHLLADRGKQNELRQTVENISQRIASEAGCLACRVFQSMSSDRELVLIEDWENLDAIHAHIESDNMSILAGAGTILTESIGVYPERDSNIREIKDIFRKRFAE